MKTKPEILHQEQYIARTPVLSRTDAEILRAVHEVKYGSVEITIHDGKVVQVERREKVRYPDQ